MTGFFIMFFAHPTMTYNHLFFSVNCTVYILLAVFLFEEPDLVKQFPEQYPEYMKRTPAFIPCGCLFKSSGGKVKD